MDSSFNAVTVALTLVLGFLMLVGPRRWLLPLMLFGGILIPMRVRFMVFGLDFMMLRVLLLFGWTRLLMRGEHRGLVFNRMDRALVVFVIIISTAYILLRADADAVIYRAGTSFSWLGLYFFFRVLLRDLHDVAGALKALFVLCLVLGVLMGLEYVTERNPMAFLGAVREYVQVREDRLRCQSSFGHPILAGTFGAALMPVFLALTISAPNRKWVPFLACLACTVIAGASGSSGPILAYVAGIAGICFWPLRGRMRTVRWCAGLLYVALDIAMKAPVWALLGRVSVLPGSTGSHRFRLFDQFIHRIGEWWLLGVESTNMWGYFLFDLANQYVRIGADGGIFALIAFFTLITMAFSGLGRRLEYSRGHPRLAWLTWGLGSMLFSQMVAFFGVSYFDQTIVLWYLGLALMAGFGYHRIRPERLAAEPDPGPDVSPSPDTARKML